MIDLFFDLFLCTVSTGSHTSFSSCKKSIETLSKLVLGKEGGLSRPSNFHTKMSTKSNEKVISRKNELKSNEDNSANNQESSVSQSLLQPPSPTRNASSSGVANVIVNPMQNR